ncbi:MAG: hypothetical protein KGV48_002650 [Alcaligenaceae bacterium]|nr:hypothetical protein [Alcaligenaceae bacterium]
MTGIAFIITTKNTEETSLDAISRTLDSCMVFAKEQAIHIPNFVVNYGPTGYSKPEKETLIPKITGLVEFNQNENIQRLYQIADNNLLDPLAKCLSLNWFILKLVYQKLANDYHRFIILEAGQTLDEAITQTALFSANPAETPSIYVPKKQISHLTASESKHVFFKRDAKAWGFDAEKTDEVLKVLVNMAKHMQDTYDNIHCLDFPHALYEHLQHHNLTEDPALQA